MVLALAADRMLMHKGIDNADCITGIMVVHGSHTAFCLNLPGNDFAVLGSASSSSQSVRSDQVRTFL